MCSWLNEKARLKTQNQKKTQKNKNVSLSFSIRSFGVIFVVSPLSFCPTSAAGDQPKSFTIHASDVPLRYTPNHGRF